MRACLLGACLLGFLEGGCVSRSHVSPESRPWSVEAEKVALISGRFSNEGESSREKVPAPRLSALLFNDLLEGFDIDSIELSPLEEGTRLWVKPYVGEVLVKEQRVLDSDVAKDGERVWVSKTKVELVDGYVVTASVFWVGGMVLPVAAWRNYRFYEAENGDLLVRLTEREIVDFLYFFPVRFSSEIWLRYPALEGGER